MCAPISLPSARRALQRSLLHRWEARCLCTNPPRCCPTPVLLACILYVTKRHLRSHQFCCIRFMIKSQQLPKTKSQKGASDVKSRAHTHGLYHFHTNTARIQITATPTVAPRHWHAIQWASHGCHCSPLQWLPLGWPHSSRHHWWLQPGSLLPLALLL